MRRLLFLPPLLILLSQVSFARAAANGPYIAAAVVGRSGKPEGVGAGLVPTRHCVSSRSGPRGRVGTSPAPTPSGSALRTSHIASYKLDVELKMDERQRPAIIEGRGQLVWRNDSRDSIPDLQFHLYLNAFKNEKTTFFRESGGQLRGDRFAAGAWGSIDLTELRLFGEDLLKTAEFIAPDDGNVDDQTVLRVTPGRQILPGETIIIDMVFTSRLPRVFARTGYWGSFAMIGQWFPKIGVWETVGERQRHEPGWNCHQFHADTEFYADFGVYDVTITTPSVYRDRVGATGALRSTRSNADGTVTYNFYEAGVHDFAWTVDSQFIKVSRTFKAAESVTGDDISKWSKTLALHPAEVRLSDVEVILLMQPEHRSQIDRHFRAAFSSLRHFGLWYGRYPYKTLTIVDPPYQGDGAEGMEYPTLVTAGTRWWPGRDQNPEEVIAHEIAHQYWYGLVATNEFEEPWMDEGMTNYSTAKVLGVEYGASVYPLTFWGINLFYFPVVVPHPLENRLLTLKGEFRDPILTAGWRFFDTTSYALNSYARASLTLGTLERFVGEDVMARIMRTYSERWRFGHPSSQDFFQIVNEVSARDFSWFFDQFFRGTMTLDYELANAESTLSSESGVGGTSIYSNEITVNRLGDAWFPVELNLTLEDQSQILLKPVLRDDGFEYQIADSATGSVRTEVWTADQPSKKFVIKTRSKLIEAKLDPHGKILLEANWTNNGRNARSGTFAGLRWASSAAFWIQSLLLTLGVFS